MYDGIATLAARAATAAIITDFDGTLAPIVEHPPDATAVPGAVELLHRLADSFAVVAVVSGRPVGFLADRLALTDHAGSGLVVSGLYGLERWEDGAIAVHPSALGWKPVVDTAAARATKDAPPGVIVEHKGLSVTVHVRTAPEHDAWARSWAKAQAEDTGLALHDARMSYELRPPLAIDKGTVVGDLIAGCTAACFLGDDYGDLPAFDALDRLAAAGGDALRVGVRSPEAPAELLERADLLVDGPAGALALLQELCAAAS